MCSSIEAPFSLSGGKCNSKTCILVLKARELGVALTYNPCDESRLMCGAPILTAHRLYDSVMYVKLNAQVHQH